MRAFLLLVSSSSVTLSGVFSADWQQQISLYSSWKKKVREKWGAPANPFQVYAVTRKILCVPSSALSILLLCDALWCFCADWQQQISLYSSCKKKVREKGGATANPCTEYAWRGKYYACPALLLFDTLWCFCTDWKKQIRLYSSYKKRVRKRGGSCKSFPRILISARESKAGVKSPENVRYIYNVYVF